MEAKLLAALAFARMLGARVILTSSSDEKLARAKKLGADVLINYRTTPDWSAAVLAATAGEGADLVVEVGGGETLAQAVKATRIGGHISVIGILVFVGLTAWDTQNIRQQYLDHHDDETRSKLAVFGALSLYLNFVNIFQLLLAFTGERE